MSNTTITALRPVNRSDEELAMRGLMVSMMRTRWPSARIVHELGLRYSTNVIDIAAITEREIIAVEIKSSRDTLERLEKQVRAFAPICAKVIVALAPKWTEAKRGGSTVQNVHARRAKNIERHDALGMLDMVGSHHVAPWLCCAESRRIEAVGWDGDSRNPFPWPVRMLEMLHVAELQQIALEQRIGVGSTHAKLVAALCSSMPGRDVARSVCFALRMRRSSNAMSDAPINVDQAPAGLLSEVGA